MVREQYAQLQTIPEKVIRMCKELNLSFLSSNCPGNICITYASPTRPAARENIFFQFAVFADAAKHPLPPATIWRIFGHLRIKCVRPADSMRIHEDRADSCARSSIILSALSANAYNHAIRLRHGARMKLIMTITEITCVGKHVQNCVQ